MAETLKEGVKFDSEKPQPHLLIPEALLAEARVFTYGAKKYAPRNWENVDPTRMINALWRHLIAYESGERYDPESHESHLAHIRCNAGMVYWHDEVKPKNQILEPSAFIAKTDKAYFPRNES